MELPKHSMKLKTLVRGKERVCCITFIFLPCIYNNYLKVFVLKFINAFLSNNDRIHFSITENKRNQNMLVGT